jgi:WD40 repeat protein
MTKSATREATRGGRRRLRIVLATLTIVGLGWAGIGLDPASLNLDGWRWIVEADSRQPRLVRMFSHDGEIGAIAWSPDGTRIAAGGQLHRALMIWDARTGALLHKLDREDGSISAVDWSPDSRYVAAGRWFTRVSKSHAAINVWDAHSGRRVHNIQGPLPLDRGENDVRTHALRFSPNGTQLAAGHGGAVTVYDVESGRLIRAIQGHPGMGRAVSFSADGNEIVTTGPEKVAPIQVFDVSSGDRLRSYAADPQIPFAVAHRPDGAELASIDRQRSSVLIWRVASGQIVRMLQGHTKAVYAVTYARDGRLLGSAAPGGGVIVWDAASGEQLTTLPDPREHADSLTFSPDGRYLAVPVGKVVRIWDLAPALQRSK